MVALLPKRGACGPLVSITRELLEVLHEPHYGCRSSVVNEQMNVIRHEAVCENCNAMLYRAPPQYVKAVHNPIC